MKYELFLTGNDIEIDNIMGNILKSLKDEKKIKIIKNNKCISVTVDAVIIKDEKIVLIKRKNDPYKNYWALPGGFVDYGESTEQAVLREAFEETNLQLNNIKLIGVYSEPNRDPRGHTISTAYYNLVNDNYELIAGDDAKEVKLFSFKEIDNMDIAFDHRQILEDAGSKYPINYIWSNIYDNIKIEYDFKLIPINTQRRTIQAYNILKKILLEENLGKIISIGTSYELQMGRIVVKPNNDNYDIKMKSYLFKKIKEIGNIDNLDGISIHIK